MQPFWQYINMGVLAVLQQSIGKVGVKEVARRTGISASTVSRIGSGLINPSLQVVEKISSAVGYNLELYPENQNLAAPRLAFAKDILGRLRNELKNLGVKHVTIFGSVARKTDTANSDIDLFLDFGFNKPTTVKLLKAEGKIIEAFGQAKVDLVSDLTSAKGQKLKIEIDKDGIRVF
jgi:predicted nucleotidyltransferase